jgi:hypothetical protein
MAARRLLDLSAFDGRLLDGLTFCRKVYDLFDQVRSGPNGVSKLRLRPTKLEKRLLEELLPLARYVQVHYGESRRIKVRWFSGSQPFDAILLSSGARVDHDFVPQRVLVEITTSVHQNEYLVREQIDRGGPSFGPEGISRDKKTGNIVSQPHVRHENELEADLADQIIARLKCKSTKSYPPNTVLIVDCIANTIVLEPEWKNVIERVKVAQAHLAFREVFLFDRITPQSATLGGK